MLSMATVTSSVPLTSSAPVRLSSNLSYVIFFTYLLEFVGYQVPIQLTALRALSFPYYSQLYGVCEVHLRPLQSVLNAAARLITGKRKFDHIASTMRDDLHWLPVRQRILFKLCTLVSKCLRRSAPPYLTDMCIPVSTASGRSCLRSCSRRDLRIPRSRLS